MNVRCSLILAGLVALGVTAAPVAEAAPTSKPHIARKATVKKTTRGGVSVSTQDIDGDGTADVVTRSRPKPKPKKN